MMMLTMRTSYDPKIDKMAKDIARRTAIAVCFLFCLATLIVLGLVLWGTWILL